MNMNALNMKPLRYYLLMENDQARESWILTMPAKLAPKKSKSRNLPPLLHRFFGYFIGRGREMKAEYDDVRCQRCGRYKDDDVFAVGFFDPFFIHTRGDFCMTGDRVFIINEKFLKVLRKAKVRGYETKPLGESGWYAIRATCRVKLSKKVMKTYPPLCPECRLPKEASGGFDIQRDLSVPQEPMTIFTTERGWPSTLWDRDLFFTEDVAMLLKAEGIKGGYCRRLLTEDDLKRTDELAKQGKRLKPTEIAILL